MKKKQHRRAFTLVELLVVIAIIGILSVMGFASFTRAQKKARNARVRGDLKAIQNAEEQYYTENGRYTNCSSGNAIGTIMDSVPRHPAPALSYTCNSGSTWYCVVGPLESEQGNCTGCSCAAGVCTFSTASNNTSFCVKNMQ